MKTKVKPKVRVKVKARTKALPKDYNNTCQRPSNCH